MWSTAALAKLADREAETMRDARFDRLYTAIVRYDGLAFERMQAEATAAVELDAALATLTVEEMRAELTNTPVDSFYERMLHLKAQRAPLPAPERTIARVQKVETPEPDVEPEQGA